MDDSALGHRRRRSLVVGTMDAPSSRKGSREFAGSRQHSRIRENVNRSSGHFTHNEAELDSSSPSTSDDMELEDLPSDEGLQDDEETGLTTKNRRRRRRRKRRNTRTDARVAREGQATSVEQSLADRNVVKQSLFNAVLIGLWYLFSLSISIYNKWMFSPDHLDFHFPLFITCLHMIVQFSLAALVLYFVPRFRPHHESFPDPATGSARTNGQADAEKPLITKNFYLTRIGPCGAATGLDIGLGNMSLKFISLTFYTMCKSSALAFVLVFAFLFRLETPSWKLVLIIFTMTVGVIMMVAGEAAFNALGFILVITAAFFSGFRWALTQILLLRHPATSNPFSSIFYLAPVMAASLLLIAVPIEGFSPLTTRFLDLVANRGFFTSVGILLFPGTIAFLMTSSEFALLQRTSVVTLSICGIFKEVVTISAAGFVFHDPLTPINLSGLVVTIISIAAYNYIKIKKMRQHARAELHQYSAVPHTGHSAPRAPALSPAAEESGGGGAGADDNDEDEDDVPSAQAAQPPQPTTEPNGRADPRTGSKRPAAQLSTVANSALPDGELGQQQQQHPSPRPSTTQGTTSVRGGSVADDGRGARGPSPTSSRRGERDDG